ncbi:MAG: hypothetical protein AAGL90_10130 [Pseudomonadota bacterium]
MRCVVSIGALVLASGAVHAAPEGPVPMGPGSSIFWTSAFDGNTDNFRETLLVQGDDFAIFQSEADWSEGDATDYFALFSGIYFNTCNLEMPTSEERQALAALWPLTEGATVEIATDEGATFSVGQSTEFYLMGEPRAAHSIDIAYKGEEPSEETILVLDDMPLTVSVNWDDGSRDSVTLVTRPKVDPLPELNTDLIGTCAALLDAKTEQN